MSLLTQFGATSPPPGATKPGRKCSPYSIALSKLLVYTIDLEPTRIDFNLGTPRSEIPSHSLQSTTTSVVIRLQTQTNQVKLPSNKLPTTVLHSFGVVHKPPNSLLKSFRVVNKLQLKHNPKHASR